MLFQEEKEKFKQTKKALTGSGPELGMGENSDWLRAGIQNGGKPGLGFWSEYGMRKSSIKPLKRQRTE